jgi:2-haloacid dehalogenase
MSVTLAFDVYGTLIDTHGVVVALTRFVGDRAPEFSQAWREKQLEYSFRRGLMQHYEDFAVCTRQALDYTNAVFGSPLGEQDKAELMAVYRVLPAFADVKAGLAAARHAGFRLFAFSNGKAEAVDALLRNAGIRDDFLGIVSVDDLRSYKPNPGVYAHFLRQAGATGEQAWLVSGNPFDLIGAVSAGMRAAWVRRSPEARFDPWGIEPTLVIDSLEQLAAGIASLDRAGKA